MGDEADIVFVVGDVHGRADLLRTLQARMTAHVLSVGATRPKVVYLGDYIDRGPGSREVLDLVLADLPGFRCVRLSGNHEVMFRAFMDDNPAGAGEDTLNWYRNGGEATLASYGIETDLGHFCLGADNIRRRLLDTLPPAHKAILLDGSLPCMHEDSRAIYVHAGLDPACSLADQSIDDLLWIRERFLSSKKDWGRIVVHGHTTSPIGPELLPNRINVDTQAFSTGRLTAAVLDGGEPRFLVGASPATYHVVVDPDGNASPGWMQWALESASSAGVQVVGLCMPDPGPVMAAIKGLGMGHKGIEMDNLIEAWGDRSSPFSRSVAQGTLCLSFNGTKVMNFVTNQVDAIRMAKQPGRSPGP